MVNRGMVVMGGVLAGLGVLFFLGSVFQYDAGAFCFPLFLIVVGAMIVFRPSISGRGGPSHIVVVGDLDRTGDWEVKDAEYWVGVADFDLDMTHAFIPPGETVITSSGFVNDIEIRLPAGVGCAVDASGFVVQTELGGRKSENILSPVSLRSAGYEQAEKRVRLALTGFVVEVKIRQS